MSGKKSNLFSWKKLKHRSNGKLQFADSSSMNSIASDNFRNADPSRSGYVPVDSKAVEATELMSLARYYEKLCSNKAHQSSTSLSTATAGTITVPGLDTSNFLHVMSSHHLNTTANNGNATENVKHSSGSDSTLHIPVFRIAQRRSHGLQDVYLSITPLDENYFDISKEHTSAALQTIDTLVAKALQLTVTSAFHRDSTDTSRPPMVVNSNYEPLFEPTTVIVSNTTSIHSNINNNNINNIRINSNNNDINNSNNNNNGSISVIDKSGEISSAVLSNTSPVENSSSQPPTSNISPTFSSNSANLSSTNGVTSSSANISAVRPSILLRSKADPYYTKPKGDLKRVQFTLPPLGSDEDYESNEKYANSCSVALDSSSSSLPLGTDTTARDYRHKAAEYLYDDYNNMQDEKESVKRTSIGSSGGCIASQLQSTSNKACTFLNPEDIDDIPSTEMSDECYSDEEEDSTIGHSSTASIFSAETQPVGLFCSSISTSTRDVVTAPCHSLGFQPSECLFLQPLGEVRKTSKYTVEKSSSVFNKNMIEGSHTNRKKKHQSKSYVEDRNDHHSQNAASRVEETTHEAAESDTNENGRAMTVYYSLDGKERLEEIATEYSLSAEEEDGDEEKGYSSKDDDATADGYTTDDTATTATTSGYYSNNVPTEEYVVSRTCSAQSGSNIASTSTEDDFDTDVGNDDETTKNTIDESRDDSEFTWQASFPSKEFTEESYDGTSIIRATEMEYFDLSHAEPGEDVLDKMTRLEVLSPATKNKPINLRNSSRGSTEEGTPGTVTKQVSTTSSTEKVKKNLNLMIDDFDQPNHTTPTATTKTTPTKSTIGWSILSPKKLLSFGTSPSSMSKTKNYSSAIRHSVEWNKSGLENSGSSPKKSSNRSASTILTSNRKVRSPSPSPRFLIKTVVHSSVGSMKSSYE